MPMSGERGDVDRSRDGRRFFPDPRINIDIDRTYNVGVIIGEVTSSGSFYR